MIWIGRHDFSRQFVKDRKTHGVAAYEPVYRLPLFPGRIPEDWMEVLRPLAVLGVIRLGRVG